MVFKVKWKPKCGTCSVICIQEGQQVWLHNWEIPTNCEGILVSTQLYFVGD